MLNRIKISVKQVQSLLEKSHISTNNYDSRQMPFFNRDQNPVSFEEHKKTYTMEPPTMEPTTIEPEFKLPFQLLALYSLLENDKVECYVNKYWTFMSLDNIKHAHQIYKEHNQHNVVDFAIMYIGMGHCYVAAYDPADNKVFIRRDGGSNGYERQDKFEFLMTYKPKLTDKITLNDFFKIMILLNDEKHIYSTKSLQQFLKYFKNRPEDKPMSVFEIFQYISIN